MAISTLRTTRDFARVWFYWKIPAMLTFGLIVVGVCLYSFSRTPLYESTAKILLLPKTNDELVVNAGQGQRQYDIQSVDSADINTEIELLKSNMVMRKTLSYFGEDSDPAVQAQGFTTPPHQGKLAELVDGLEAEPIPQSNMIEVALSSVDQDRVADLLNKLLDIYINYHKHVYSKEESEAFYDEQKKFYGKKLAEARDKLKAFNDENHISNMPEQINANIALISQFNGELQNLEIAIAENAAKIKMLDRGVHISGNDIVMSTEMRNLPVIMELARGLVPLLIKRTEISKTFTRESREYRQIDDQIAMLRQEIKKESIQATKTNQMELDTLKIKRDALIKRVNYLKDQTKQFDQKQQELSALELDVEIAKKNYLLYGSKTEDSRLYAMRNQTNISNVVVVEPAIRPVSAKSPKKLLAFEVAVVLGGFAALLLPFILETLDHSLKTADDVEGAFSIPVICSYREV